MQLVIKKLLKQNEFHLNKRTSVTFKDVSRVFPLIKGIVKTKLLQFDY